MTGRRTDLLASLCIVLTGLLWGTYWIPLRGIAAEGLAGPWATLAPTATAALVLAPFVGLRWRRARAGGWPLVAVGLTSGTAFVLYSNALLLTDVVTALLLFYLTPVWSTLFARLRLGHPITATRVGAIGLGLAGMAVILGVGDRLPLPRNVGDWLGLASGIAWALAAVAIRRRTDVSTVDNAFAFLAGGTLTAIVAPLLLLPEQLLAGPSLTGEPALMLGGLAVIAVVWFVVPLLSLMWGTKRLDPGRVGILLMGEVLVGALTAAWLTDEPFGWRQVIGGAMIVTAALVDILARRPIPAVESSS